MSALVQGGLQPQALARELALGVLLLARLAPLCWLAPWLAVRRAPAPLALAVTLVLALCLWPVASAGAPALPLALSSLLALSLREALLGTVYALALALPLLALEWAGRLYGRFSGTPGSEHPYAALQLLLGVSVFFALGGHRVALRTLADALARRPLGAPAPLHALPAVALSSARLVGDAFASALLLSLPVGAAIGLAELAVALAARSAAGSGLTLALLPGRAALGLLAVWAATLILLGSLPELLTHGLRAARVLLQTL